MKKSLLFIVFALFIYTHSRGQEGFASVTNLSSIPVTKDTGDKPQAKVWTHAGKHWAVLASNGGTNLWRLDGTTWTNVLKLSSKTSSKADCKVVGDITHILLFQGRSSQFVSVEYDAAGGTYRLWSKRTSTVGISLDAGVETATIDMDSKGRIWLASAGTTSAYVRWSDAPYNRWSSAITVATGITDDDICAVVALPGKIGVFWSNQNKQRFGFKMHLDGDGPAVWSDDEVPASQSALAIGNGMADDHMNLVAGSDGTLYCGIKTSYDTYGYPEICMLVRRPSGAWDNLYEVAQAGTRPIVVLNEATGKVRIAYTSSTAAGNIIYKESAVSDVAFGSEMPLMNGSFNDATSTKAGFEKETVIMASNATEAVSVLVTTVASSGPALALAPALSSPSDGATGVETSPVLRWEASAGADSYQAQVSAGADFASPVLSQENITATSVTAAGLSAGATYYWRARAVNGAGAGEWSPAWRFTTAAAAGAALVGHWAMEEGGGSSLADGSPYGHTASLSGAPAWVAGPVGQALRLDGSSQYATVADAAALDLSGALTVAAWIRPERAATQYIVKKADQNAVDGYELSLSSGGKVFFRFNQKSAGDAYRVNSAASYPTDGATWMHVAVTYDGAVLRLYLNGQENGSRQLSSPPAIAANALALTLGAGNGGYRGLRGGLDEVRLYSGALSPEQIRELSARPATASTSSAMTAAPLGATEVEDELEVYPNPFTTTATVSFKLLQDGVYAVALYDSRGAIVAHLKQGAATAGKRISIDINGSQLSEGLYLLRLQTSGGVKTAKLILGRQ